MQWNCSCNSRTNSRTPEIKQEISLHRIWIVHSCVLALFPIAYTINIKNSNLTFTSTHTEKLWCNDIMLLTVLQLPDVCVCVCVSSSFSITWVVYCHMTAVTHLFSLECGGALYWCEMKLQMTSLRQRCPLCVCVFVCVCLLITRISLISLIGLTLKVS